MPTIYTEDKVGKAIEDHYVGTQGVLTGSAANQIGYNQYQARQAPAVGGAPARGGGSYQPLGPTRALLDAIPLTLLRSLALVGAIAACHLTFQSGILDVSAFTGMTASGVEWVGLAVIAMVGAFVGYHALQFAIVIVDLCLQLAIVAVMLGAILAVLWLIGRMAGVF